MATVRAEAAPAPRRAEPAPRAARAAVVDGAARPDDAARGRHGGADRARRRGRRRLRCCAAGHGRARAAARRGRAARRRGPGLGDARARRRHGHPARPASCPAIGDDEVYEVWVQRAGVMEPRSTFVLGMRRDRRGRGPGPARRRRGGLVTREPRGGSASRPPSRCSCAAVARARSAPSGAPVSSAARWRPATGTRAGDERLLLELRAADLPRLHDLDPGRDALPGVRAPADPGPQPGRRRRARADAPATYALIAHLRRRLRRRDRVGGGGGGAARRRRHGLFADGSASFGPAASPTASRTGSSPSAFLHAGLLHLGLNMFALYILGTLLEPAIGTRALRRHLLRSRSSAARSAPCCSTRTSSPSAPRAAIFGLMAAAFLIARDRGLDELASQIGFFVIINLVFTFSVPNISVGGHIGGLIGGGARGAARRRARARRRSRTRRRSRSPALVGARAWSRSSAR